MKPLNPENNKTIIYHTEFLNCVDVQIVGAGQQKSSANHHYPRPANQDSDTIQYITKGRGTIEINGRRFELQPHDIFLLPAKQSCRYYADPEAPYSYYWISFKGNFSHYILELSNLNADSPVLSTHSREYHKHFVRIFQAFKQKNNMFCTLLQSLAEFYNIFYLIQKEHVFPNESKETQHNLVKQAIEFMKNSFQSAITCDDIAKHVFLTRAYFTQIFTMETGIPPKKYLNNLRLSAACQLLTESTKPITEIAAEVGFSPKNFSRIFTREFRISPLKYRTQNKTLASP